MIDFITNHPTACSPDELLFVKGMFTGAGLLALGFIHGRVRGWAKRRAR